jgi:hypothetical protein
MPAGSAVHEPFEFFYTPGRTPILTVNVVLFNKDSTKF